MDVTMLGTGAGHRSRERAASSNVVRDGRTSVLVDCGPGTLDALVHHRVPSHIDAILLTHGHPDHVGDLFNVLAHWSATGRGEPVAILAPPEALDDVSTDVARLTRMGHLDYPVTLVDVLPDATIPIDDLVVAAFPTDHRVESRGYRVSRRQTPARIDMERVRALGLRAGAWLQEIKSGRAVSVDGREVTPADVCQRPSAAVSVAITGDTAVSERVTHAVRGVDVLVHDATFARDKQGRAARWGHATAQQAAEVARDADVRALVLTHFSHRYSPAAMPHLAEAADVFAGLVLVANDGDAINARTLSVTSGTPGRQVLVAAPRPAAGWPSMAGAVVAHAAQSTTPGEAVAMAPSARAVRRP